MSSDKKLSEKQLSSNMVMGSLKGVFEGMDISEVDLGGPDPSPYERLHDAVKDNNMMETEQILKEHNLEERRLLINSCPKKRKPLLSIAAQGNDVSMIKLLKSFEADVMMPDSKGCLPLHLAAKKGYANCCKELLSGQVEQDLLLNAANKEGMLPHMLAAKHGHQNCCNLLVDETNVNHEDNEGNTALIITVERADDKIAELLLEKGANLNHQNKIGYAAVHKAAQLRSPTCFEALLRKNANVIVKTYGGESVLHLAVRSKEREICVRYLLNNDSVRSIINDPNEQGKTPLHVALEARSCKVAHLLLQHGACQKACFNKVMPIHLASERGYYLVCGEILSQDPLSIDKKNNEELSPLLIAASHKRTKVCNVLIKYKANLREVDKENRTPLHLALLKGGCTETVKALVKGSISMMAENGYTELHTAVKESSYSCCKLLLKEFKDATSCLWKKDKEDCYPLDIAYEVNHEKIFKLFLEKMAEEQKEQDVRQRIHGYVHKALDDMENRCYVVEAVMHSWVEVGLEPLCGDDKQCTIFHKLIQDHPNLAKVALDRSLTRSDNNFQVFENLHITDEDISTQDPECCKDWRLIKQEIRLRQGAMWFRKHPITLMIQKERNELLQHKLTEKWIDNRWQHHIKITHRLLLLFHLMAFVFQLGFISTSWNEHHISLKYNTTLEEYCDFPPAVDGRDPNPLPTTVHLVFFSVYMLTYIFQVIIYILNGIMIRKWYRLDLCIKMIELFLMLCVFLPLSQCQLQTGIRKDWAWQCGVSAILFSWIHLLNFVNKPQRNILFPVAKDFAQILCFWLLYVFMVELLFAFLFHLLLQEQEVFQTMGSSFVKTFTWMLLDLSYSDTFKSPAKVPYTFLTNALFLVFIVSVGCFIVNLISHQSQRNKKQHTTFSFQSAAYFATMVMEFEVWFLWFRRYSGKINPQGNQTMASHTQISRKARLKKCLKDWIVPKDDDDNVHAAYVEQLESMLQEQRRQIEILKRMKAKIDSVDNTINSLTTDITHSIRLAVREQLDRVCKK